jgi:hypothetical protein
MRMRLERRFFRDFLVQSEILMAVLSREAASVIEGSYLCSGIVQYIKRIWSPAPYFTSTPLWSLCRDVISEDDLVKSPSIVLHNEGFKAQFHSDA